MSNLAARRRGSYKNSNDEEVLEVGTKVEAEFRRQKGKSGCPDLCMSCPRNAHGVLQIHKLLMNQLTPCTYVPGNWYCAKVTNVHDPKFDSLFGEHTYDVIYMTGMGCR